MAQVIQEADVRAEKVLERLSAEVRRVPYRAYLNLMSRAGYSIDDSNVAFERSGCSVLPDQTIDFTGLRA